MSDALSLSAVSMLNDMQQLELISHNLANANTHGYKRDLMSQGFERTMLSSMASMDGYHLSQSAPTVQRHTDFSSGALQHTANPLDVAIEGEGYFTLMGKEGLRYSRVGSFSLDASGRLVGAKGLPVQGTNGEIQLSGGELVIGQDGSIREDGELVDQLSLVSFSRPDQLIKDGAGLFRASPEVGPQMVESIKVRQGYLEASNVNPMTEMLGLMSTLRHFEMTSKVLKEHDDMIGTAISSIADF